MTCKYSSELHAQTSKQSLVNLCFREDVPKKKKKRKRTLDPEDDVATQETSEADVSVSAPKKKKKKRVTLEPEDEPAAEETAEADVSTPKKKRKRKSMPVED